MADERGPRLSDASVPPGEKRRFGLGVSLVVLVIMVIIIIVMAIGG